MALHLSRVGITSFETVSQLGTLRAVLAARHALPTIYYLPEFVEAGGLMSYGSSNADLTRLGRHLCWPRPQGREAADLPVMQPTKFESVINLQTARLLGIELPPTHEVLE